MGRIVPKVAILHRVRLEIVKFAVLLPEVEDDLPLAVARDHIQQEAEMMIMRRDRKWKVVFYLGQENGELYDLEADPMEYRNLWHDAAHSAVRDELVAKLLKWQVGGTLRSRIKERARAQQPMAIQPVTA